MKEQLVNQIVELEWKQFQNVKNEGGRADCQDNWETFEIMRKSQFLVWNREVLESYLRDLREAEENGWNLLTEKYARMMASTAPEQYREIEGRLPARSPKRIEQQEELIAMQVRWEETFAKRYPGVAGRGRRLHSYEDTSWDTSIETYARGELGTYSDRTVELLGNMYRDMDRNGENLSVKILENMVHFYGYSSLEQAEERHKICIW
ncbi:MAG: DUF4125 family protein [Dorea sp.]|nr:DUF4125 family protein [Dorea sp.]